MHPSKEFAISTGQLEPHLELCLSFLTAFLKADHCGKSEAKQAANPPAMPDAAITAPDSSKSSVQSRTDAASPDAQDEAQNGQDRQRDKTALTIKLHLHAAVVVTKMLLLTQSVRAQTSAAQRHGPLLTAACKLLADLPNADDSAHDFVEKNEEEFDYLIKLYGWWQTRSVLAMFNKRKLKQA